MFPFSVDPATEDPGERDARLETDAREQEWCAFIDRMAHYCDHPANIELLMHQIGRAMMYERIAPNAYESELERVCMDFAQSFGWDGVLRCVARAIADAKGAEKQS